MAATSCLVSLKYKISLVFFCSLFFCFISGVDYIRGEGSNYPRKVDTAPGTRNPGARIAWVLFFRLLSFLVNYSDYSCGYNVIACPFPFPPWFCSLNEHLCIPAPALTNADPSA